MGADPVARTRGVGGAGVGSSQTSGMVVHKAQRPMPPIREMSAYARAYTWIRLYGEAVDTVHRLGGPCTTKKSPQTWV